MITPGSEKKVKAAAEKVAQKYKEWLMAGLEYNLLVAQGTGTMVTSNYTIRFADINIPKKGKKVKL